MDPASQATAAQGPVGIDVIFLQIPRQKGSPFTGVNEAS